MDTRAKIMPALPPSLDRVLVGYFDPLHAGHVRRFRDLCGPGETIAVIVSDPAEPILPAQARAELVAALDCVSHVTLGNADAAPSKALVVDDRLEDAGRTRSFTQHVAARNMLSQDTVSEEQGT